MSIRVVPVVLRPAGAVLNASLRSSVAVVALVALARAAAAQTPPLGPEFRVNTYTTSNQANPSAAMDAAGGFVIVWDSDLEDGDSAGIFGQRYDAFPPRGRSFLARVPRSRQARARHDSADPGFAYGGLHRILERSPRFPCSTSTA